MVNPLSQLIEDIFGRGSIGSEDVLALRRAVFGDGVVSVEEGNGLFRLNTQINDKPIEWSDFFVEAMSDFIVRQAMPHGYVDEANAIWLINHISSDGVVESLTELRLLVKVLKSAKDSPDRLVNFALEQVKAAVLYGAGLIGRSRKLEPGIIGEDEVQILRDVLYASGGDQHIAITRSEAEVLCDLNDATNGADNHPSWTDLYVKGLTNHLMFITTYETPDRADVLRREAWLKGDGGVFAGFAKLKFKDIAAAFTGELDDNADMNAIQDARLEQARKGEIVDAAEAAWLVGRIGLDGVFNGNEKALIRYLEAESPYLAVSLQSLLEQARAA